MLSKAQGCFVGLIAGDNLGSLVEFNFPSENKTLYPKGFKELQNGGGTFNIRAGQPTDDGEMAITLAKCIIANKGFNYNYVFNSYVDWAESEPFDIGVSISNALLYDEYDKKSASNGSLMRVAPIGIYGANLDLDKVGALAIADAKCTHNNEIVFETNSIFARAISLAIKSDIAPKELFEQMIEWATIPLVRETMCLARIKPPENMATMNKGYCLTALRNAMYHLYHTSDIVKAMNKTIKQGGDADTNAAILGALFGAVYGLKSIPQQWIDSILSCEPVIGKTSKPRPKEYWPTSVLQLAQDLLNASH